MNVTCTSQPCPIILSAACVFYEDVPLLYTGIVQNDNLEKALQKIDAKFHDAAVGYGFTNGVIQLVPGDPVKLGGSLIENTTINGNSFPLTFIGNLHASSFVTIGGASTQFVKGDGSLDNTVYQPAGNYLTGLSGDVISSGPGIGVATLAIVNANPGTYGDLHTVPQITVDAKGRVTNITPVAIDYPLS